ncbi:MAG: hypothetical protein J5764_06925 [Bacteroidales bacterium]|nr:hypothetical protein [Bacteroidales bacterium]
MNPYFKFIFSRKQFPEWGITALAVLIGCTVTAIFRPWPSTMTDSFGYVLAAIENRFLVFRPFGYSAFLRFLHLISSNIHAIFISQALLYWLSLTLLLLAVKKYWPPKGRPGLFLLLEFTAAFSPAAILMLNALMADALLCCLVFIMLAMMLVMMQERSFIALLLYGAAFFAALHTRYSAMFFPLAFVPILFFHEKRWFGLTAVALTAVLFGVFHSQICADMKKEAGVRQFSTGFDGWQLANNGMHVIPWLDAAERQELPKDGRLRDLHRLATSGKYDKRIRELTADGTRPVSSFLWYNDLPLKEYLYLNMQQKGGTYLTNWVKLGSGPYSDYGKWLILHYPGKYMSHYFLPNLKNVFIPEDTEILSRPGEVEAGQKELCNWFKLDKNVTLKERTPFLGKKVVPLLPWVELAGWILMLGAALFMLIGRKKLSKHTRIALWMLFLFGFVYFGTTMFASPVVLRYWMPMHAVKLIFAWICVHR